MNNSRIIQTIIIIICLALLSLGETAYADDEMGQRRGLLAGAGPALGFESNVFLTVTGGAATRIGYRFNDRYSVLIAADLFYTRDNRVDYLIVPLRPMFKLNFDSNFFAFIGGGAAFTWASNGRKFGANVPTAARSYWGWNAMGGGGYDIWWRENLSISPEIGVDYIRVASKNLVVPLARINVGWIF